MYYIMKTHILIAAQIQINTLYLLRTAACNQRIILLKMWNYFTENVYDSQIGPPNLINKGIIDNKYDRMNTLNLTLNQMKSIIRKSRYLSSQLKNDKFTLCRHGYVAWIIIRITFKVSC